MRYVIVDLEGASRDYFSSREAAREAILDIEDEAPGTSRDLYVVVYDDEGREVGSPERGDELLNKRELVWGQTGLATIVSGASSTTQMPAKVPTLQRAGASR